jgi:hypothetical protein
MFCHEPEWKALTALLVERTLQASIMEGSSMVHSVLSLFPVIVAFKNIIFFLVDQNDQIIYDITTSPELRQNRS